MAPLDWFIIGAYGLGMLGVGWYYARQTKTADDYLLGGRQMKPLMVGLSLFATLLSTVSYLSWPGEIIKYGPMFLCQIASYPFIILVVGWLMIPFIMKLNVTSAYEILQARLGISVRLLGSVFFLSLRLIWMSVIIYATVSKVLIPLLGLEPVATPYLCAAMALITVTYTSMGGLRAVVLTDAIQTVILLGGAILALTIITIKIGGTGAWFPSEWPAHWPDPEFGYDSKKRVTFVGVFIAAFTWYVCTSGSDQMAIQRYLATRNVRSARRVLITSMTTDALVTLFLGALGLALLAYFQSHPEMLPTGQAVITNADTLFPHFIIAFLPAGITGLIIAALLAAAMSSLSSGLNSSSSVITTDYFDLIREEKGSEADRVKFAKYVSVAIGVVVVFLSSYVGVIKGNLLEVAYKTVNTLVAPLFGLFFMAMFVRWATAFGTIVGAVFGLGVVVAINYWQEITGAKGISFLWAMPMGFVVQAITGSLASLLPIGPGPKPLIYEAQEQ